MKNDIDKINYPHFITDKPEGKDLYEGKSQDRIADNICQFITENETSNRKVIGVEGEWGSGKSNVIEILKNKLKDYCRNNKSKEYYFFVFDAWGHQEDLKRRSILEELLAKLILDEVLNGDKSIWDKKLKELLAKKVEKERKDIPKLSWALILAILGIILMPITKFLAEYYLKSLTTPPSAPNICNYLIAVLILSITFTPLILWILYSLFKAKCKWRKVFEELFYVYKGEQIINTSEETISENEATVQQFIKFLSDLETGSTKKLVIVFDNMDRLPATKVKEIWSSIHTFFASDDKKLETWAIVPFDDTHICNIFKKDNDGDDGDKHRADSYIHKTFSIVFHIAPPILSDWKSFFNYKFKEAFEYEPPPEQNIETIFDYHHISIDDPKIKPRDIICFINDLVALKKLWGKEIDFKYLALFALKRSDILDDPFNNIISKEYLGTVESLFKSDENLETNISALTFNVPLDKADEILLKPTIEKALKGKGKLIDISKSKAFFPVFNSAFYNSQLDLIHTIDCLDELPEAIQENPQMQNYWDTLSSIIMNVAEFELKYVATIKKLARRLKNNNRIEQILKYLFIKSITLNDKNQKLYSGIQYHELINDIESLLKDIWKEKSITELLPDNDVEPDEYFEFIKSCPKTYQKYKVICNDKKINDYLIAQFDANGISQYLELLDIIKAAANLSEFEKHISDIIPALTPALTPELTPVLTDYQLTLTNNIIDVGKHLSLNDKLLFVIPENIAIAILAAAPTHERVVDLLLSIISANISSSKPEHLTEPFKQVSGNISYKDSFILSYKYYLNYDELIQYYLNFPSELIKNVICELTLNADNLTITNPILLLSKYVEINASIFDNKTDLSNKFISILNSFYNESVEELVTLDNLIYINPIIKDNYSTDCKLIQDIIVQADKLINGLSKDEWISALKNYEKSNIISLFEILIDVNKYSSNKLTQNANDAYLEVIKSISKKEMSIPTKIDLWDRLFKMHLGNPILNFQNIRDELFKSARQGGITMQELLFFESGLFQYGKLNQNQDIADETLRLILIPLAANDEQYINLLKKNATYIKQIIEEAKDSVIDFKNALDSNCLNVYEISEIKQFSEELIKKYNQLSIELNNADSDNSKNNEKETILGDN